LYSGCVRANKDRAKTYSMQILSCETFSFRNFLARPVKLMYLLNGFIAERFRGGPMKKSSVLFLAVALARCWPSAAATTRYVSPFGGHLPPFTDWSSAATNIQAAIDSSSAGDLILVTNGVYSTGGKAMVGTLTNRVTLDKALTVQSVNGPVVTTIIGRVIILSPQVRCAWLTNGATLSGFSMLYGYTQSAGDGATLQSGGGVWCASASAVVTNCIIQANNATLAGGGIYGGTIKNCRLQSSSVTGSSNATGGGGAANGVLNNCLVSGNSSSGLLGGGGTYSCVLSNCTSVYNTSSSGAGGSSHDQLYNCIIYFNSGSSFSTANYDSLSMLQYCCTTPQPQGPSAGNITTDPLLVDRFHLSAGSPCRGAGNAAYARGVDIDGQAWFGPPSIGCDEWRPEPAIGAWTWVRPGTTVSAAALTVSLAGQLPITCYWAKDGQPIEESSHYVNSRSPSLLVRQFGLADAGLYQVAASNSYGMTSALVRETAVRCVDAGGALPTPPYADWPTAATNIQDAVDSSGVWDVILVTNGVYSYGGWWDGSSSNRVSFLGRLGVLLLSLNGPDKTIIEGQRASSATNAPGPSRCVYGGGAISGFTLRNGEVTNSASFPGLGGGISGGTAAFCILSNNAAGQGGGAWISTLNNCLVTANFANVSGGGCLGGILNDCTVTFNSASGSGCGTFLGSLTNCIVYFNTDPRSAPPAANYSFSGMQNCCSTPLPPGVSNISSDPHLVDARHLALDSPCRGAGSPTNVAGSDLDGNDWANPPSIGCDEVVTNDFSGPLAVGVTAAWNEVPVGRNMLLTGQIAGRAAGLQWCFGDGPALTNASYLAWHAWTNAGDYVVTFTAWNNDNPSGVSTNLLVHVVPLAPPLLSAANWSVTNFGFQFSCQAGVSYVVEKATNLAPPITWRTVQTLYSTGGTAQVYDNPGTNRAQFYRARTQ
jgi:hypothetical protein